MTEHYLELVDKIRAAVPDIALTTDIIVGFRRPRKILRRRWSSAGHYDDYVYVYIFQEPEHGDNGWPIPEEVIENDLTVCCEVQTISAEKAGKLTGQTLRY